MAADRAGTLDKFKAAEPTCSQFEEKLARYTKASGVQGSGLCFAKPSCVLGATSPFSGSQPSQPAAAQPALPPSFITASAVHAFAAGR